MNKNTSMKIDAKKINFLIIISLRILVALSWNYLVNLKWVLGQNPGLIIDEVQLLSPVQNQLQILADDSLHLEELVLELG